MCRCLSSAAIAQGAEAGREQVRAASSQLLVANPIQRYALGDRTPGLQYDADGSLTLILQADAPKAAPQGNWLPTPEGPFNLLLRLYLPKGGALDGSYRLPTIARIEP
ncbi:DUF1214 domain-containing protein [Pseudomonas sp. GM48]|uniref:DUF1214 domain-containing protein n=1 Tax=Pseudomonas sp. GM48 TaxID=1144330 RepID=UPI000270530B|nr:DUF1214 domain-containing protein [Pseudomonas sp. GM48]EJM48918.1 hypothetical protein PMI28_05474 [Pseudomonas sp. GM48]